MEVEICIYIYNEVALVPLSLSLLIHMIQLACSPSLPSTSTKKNIGHMTGVVSVDRAKMRVRVRAGTRVSEVSVDVIRYSHYIAIGLA